jgi:hypothetical protein
MMKIFPKAADQVNKAALKDTLIHRILFQRECHHEGQGHSRKIQHRTIIPWNGPTKACLLLLLSI